MKKINTITRRDFLGRIQGVAICSVASGTFFRADLARAAIPSDKSPAEDVGDRACLFLDDRFVEKQTGLTRTWHQGKPLLEPAIVGDAWDKWPHLFGSAIYNPQTKIYQMWYSSIREGIFYAESRDGRTWTKPKLGLIDANGSKENNWVMSSVSLPNVLLDLNEKDPAARYKLFAWDHIFYSKEPKEDRENGHTLFGSPDGIHWKLIGKGIPGRLMPLDERCANFITPDTNQVIWDDLGQRYLATFRTYPKRWELGEFEVGRRRSIGITSAKQITGPWEPIITSVVPDEQDDAAAAKAMREIPPGKRWTELYSMPLFNYGNHYIGLLSLIHVALSNDRVMTANAPGGGDLQLAFSHDGMKWHRPVDRKPLISQSNASDLHPTYAACSAPIEMGDEIWIFYSEQNSSHPTAVNPNSQIRAAAWRKDGFASLVATGQKPGTLTTPPLRFAGEKLELNVETNEGGSVRVALLSASGKPIKGFEESKCDVMKQGSVAHTVTWKGRGNLAALRNDPIRIQITLRNASLFSIRFANKSAA